MAVSIVSKQYGDDSQAPIVEPSTNEITVSSVAQEYHTDVSTSDEDTFPVANLSAPEENTPEVPTTTDETNNGRLNDLHPEEVVNPIEEKTPIQESSEISIPNMYIKADTETSDVPSDVAIFSEEKKKESDGGWDMDDLLDDESQIIARNQEETIAAAPSAQETPTESPIQQPLAQDPLVAAKQENVFQKEPQEIKKSLPTTAPKKSLTKSLAMAAAGLFGVVVIGFVVMTMFPAGIDGSEQIPAEDIIAQEPVIEEPIEDHAAAEPKTPQEIARGELNNYSSLGEEYYALGRDLKDRNMVRYALYVEKKAKDLIDMLDLDPNMDTKDIVVYFAQFDDYLKTLADWKAELGDTLPVAGSSTIIEENMFDQPAIPFTDIPTNYYNDSNTGSTQSGTSLTKPEQPELSDG